MKKQNRLGKDYVYTSNFASTLNGGSAFASVELFRENDHYRLEVFVPGVNEDDYGLEVKDSHLIVYHWMHIEFSQSLNISGGGFFCQLPLFEGMSVQDVASHCRSSRRGQA